jgi:hypothetical protein
MELVLKEKLEHPCILPSFCSILSYDLPFMIKANLLEDSYLLEDLVIAV